MCTICGCGNEETGHDHHHDHEHHAHGHEHHSHTHVPRDPHESAARVITFERELLAKNRRLAEENRRTFLSSGTKVLNLIGSPGAGKTALLEATIRRLQGHVEMAVLEGDQATALDAERIVRAGCRAVQINTGAGCHLDASMIAAGVRALSPIPARLVFVENVGNLVCPALFDLGEQAKVVVMSVTEGEDKPIKYPHVFRAASVFVLSKMDLLPHVDFDVARCLSHARSVNPDIGVLKLSARSGDGVDAWCSFVTGERPKKPVAKEAS